MALASGTRLGPYEIGAPLGAGGMGEVYRARDPRLGRDVAIKILPESFASEAGRLRRFEQEARAVAALNHPNILSVHDMGAHGGIQYIVTELLEGETLRERLNEGALAPRRATELAVQMAHGLSAAHDKGIVHRDLKPENIFITKDSRAKVLDFGLAKQPTALVSDDAATLATSVQTAEGMILGTVGYMAPEQISGKLVDHRTDIFAFGSVLYEMLSGRRAFRRNSSVETLAAILKEDPPEIVATGEHHVPPALERIVRRCLEKNPGQRFQSAKDLTFALENLSAGVSQQREPMTMSASKYRWRKMDFVLATVALAAAALAARGFIIHRQEPPEYRQVSSRSGYIPEARFGPDGQSVVYDAAWDHPPFKMYSSRLDGTELRDLGLPPSELLAVSHSGELAITLEGKTSFGEGDRLARVPLTGGAPRELLSGVFAADWSPDGSQLAVARAENGKCLVEYPIAKLLYETVGYVTDMRLSPQADAIAFLDHPILGDDRGSVALLDLNGRKRTLTNEWNGTLGLAWSPDGKEIWFTATSSGEDRALYAVSRSGKKRLVLRIPGEVQLEDIASDGRVLLERIARRYEVAVGQIGGAPRLLSWLQWMEARGVSRDGKFAVIGDMGTREKDYSVYLANLDGSPPLLLGRGAGGGISPDNKWVASILPTDTTKVIVLPTGVGETRMVTAPNFRYATADWTSDGRALVVRASESGRPLRFWRQSFDAEPPRAITPEGLGGKFLIFNHSDYVITRDSQGTPKLFPVDKGDPKSVLGLTRSEWVIGGAQESDTLYVTPDASAVPLQVLRVNLRTGIRKPFIAVLPADPTGIIAISDPIFTTDEKKYVFTQVRALSVLYVAAGLK
jgi:serine/threonine protein kinase/WD40 repeat protein